ncbi:MAG: Crp/Fnr family transcriptional regulator [Candidatus Omnitrophica bacterium]|nr:Crp/Fnr family transcriptional regulator [Candidatus Omnitrophota bacterium]
MKHGSWIRATPIFQHLSARRVAAIAAHARIERYEKGETLFRQGERAEAVWMVLEGWVHLVRSAAPYDGSRAVVLFTITPAEALCGISAIEPREYTASGVAGTDSRILRIAAAAFNEALTHEPEFAYHVLRLCADRIRHMAEQYGVMAEPVSRRLVRTILRLRRQFGDTIRVTHRELAQMSWTTTESAIRTVRGLKRRGFVSGTRGRLVMRKAAALERFLAQPAG